MSLNILKLKRNIKQWLIIAYIYIENSNSFVFYIIICNILYILCLLIGFFIF
jgi:hypothetical protein